MEDGDIAVDLSEFALREDGDSESYRFAKRRRPSGRSEFALREDGDSEVVKEIVYVEAHR